MVVRLCNKKVKMTCASRQVRPIRVANGVRNGISGASRREKGLLSNRGVMVIGEIRFIPQGPNCTP